MESESTGADEFFNVVDPHLLLRLAAFSSALSFEAGKTICMILNYERFAVSNVLKSIN